MATSVAGSQIDQSLLALLPAGPTRMRGGIESEGLFPVNATSEAYAGLPGAASMVFDITSTANKMIDLSHSFVETQYYVEANVKGHGWVPVHRIPALACEERLWWTYAAARECAA